MWIDRQGGRAEVQELGELLHGSSKARGRERFGVKRTGLLAGAEGAQDWHRRVAGDRRRG